jgi:hypothetical protein
MNASPADSEAPNCWQCRHFSVSWDPNLPYACRLMGFKSRILPAIEVLRADGTRCHGFQRKPAGGIDGVNQLVAADAALTSPALQSVSGRAPAASSQVSTTASTTAPAKSSQVKGRYSTFNKLA